MESIVRENVWLGEECSMPVGAVMQCSKQGRGQNIIQACLSQNLLFLDYHEDGGSNFLWNISNY